jgi:hypothetical protein
MKNNGKNASERAQHSDPRDTPTAAPAIEPSPECAPALEVSTEVRAIAPEYEFYLVTISDRFGIETRWMVPFGEPLSSKELETLIAEHVHVSQAETRRS